MRHIPSFGRFRFVVLYEACLQPVLHGSCVAIVLQRFLYGTAAPVTSPDEEDILEQTLRLEEEDARTP